jgi:hypothetical protein
MGTRGIFGVIVDKKEKITYNHYDSYPDSLGVEMLGAARRVAKDFSNYQIRARKIQLVTDTKKPPTIAQIKKLEKYSDVGVASGKLTDWYVLMRKLQGDVLGTLDCGIMIDSADFAQDSLFCEFGWIINFDDETFECYRGFVKSIDPPPRGRFHKAVIPNTRDPDKVGYQAIHLLGSFALKELPSDEEFYKQIGLWEQEACKFFGEEDDNT